MVVSVLEDADISRVDLVAPRWPAEWGKKIVKYFPPLQLPLFGTVSPKNCVSGVQDRESTGTEPVQLTLIFRCIPVNYPSFPDTVQEIL